MIRLKRYILLLLVLLLGNAYGWNKARGADQDIVVCDNGLSDWLKSDSDFGQWIAKSTRIVKLKNKKYQPQFKDCADEKATWIRLFEDDHNYDALSTAQHQIRRVFEIKKEVCDAFQYALNDKR